MYIAGRNCPNFRVLSDFRKDHGKFFRACFKQTVALAMALGLVSLGHVSLDGSKFKANSSKHKATSYGRLKEKELCEEIEALTAQAERCDKEEDQAYPERTGYESPEDLRDTKKRLKKVRETKQLLEARESESRPGQEIEDQKQISFADPEARIMKRKGGFRVRVQRADQRGRRVAGDRGSAREPGGERFPGSETGIGGDGGRHGSSAREAEPGQRLLFGEEPAGGVRRPAGAQLPHPAGGLGDHRSQSGGAEDPRSPSFHHRDSADTVATAGAGPAGSSPIGVPSRVSRNLDLSVL